MPSNDFFGLIAFYLFGTLVPGDNSAFGIEEKNGIVLDALDQKPKDIVACRAMNGGP